MRILHILDHSIPLQSGYTFRTRNILREQAELGWKTSHVTGLKHIADCPSEEDIDGLHFYRTAKPGGLAGKLPILNQMQVVRTLQRRVEEVIALERPDVLHAHSPALNGLAALRAGKKFGLPVVYECRAFWEDAAVDHGTSSEGGLRYRLTQALETKVFKEADAVTTICEGLRKDIVERGVDPGKVTVIPNAVNVEDFKFRSSPDLALRSELNPGQATVIAFIGSFYKYEGIQLLLEAMPGFLAKFANVKLLLIGGGPEQQRISDLIESLNLQESVIQTGRVPHARVPAYYSLVDMLVYPRLSMRLTELVTPLKPLESMALGKLVLASNVGGHRELIRHAQNGYLFEANSSDALLQALCEAMASKNDWEAIAKCGRDYVETDRNWQNSVSRYQSVYTKLLP